MPPELVSKVTRRFVPFLILLYLIAYLDRVNVGFAALTMNKDLGISPYVYGWGAGIFFLGDRKSTRLNSSHQCLSRMPSSA